MNARPAVAEFAGTALLLAAVVGSGIMAERLCGGNTGLALLANAIATGGALVALILAFGPVSGAHFNPAVTLADAWQRGLPWRAVAPYVAAQICGAVCGTALANGMFGLPLFFFSHHERSGAGLLVSEFIATFGLLAVIWGCVRSRGSATPFAVHLVRESRRHHRALAHRHVCRHPSARRSGLHRRATARRRGRHGTLRLARAKREDRRRSRRAAAPGSRRGMTLTVREATIGDAPAITQIYNAGIASRRSTLDTALWSVEQTAEHVRAGAGTNPAVVVLDGDEVVGFAWSAVYLRRACYDRVSEFSVYVAPHAQHRGAGRLALGALIERCERLGFWKLTSRIFTDNVASRTLCARLGFREVGVYRRHGRLDGVWKDCVIVERLLAAAEDDDVRSVLFVCIHNSARSQMAEAFVNARHGDRLRAYSAGLAAGALNPIVVDAMHEAGIDIGSQRSKSVDDADVRSRAYDYVATVCDEVSAEACPIYPSRGERLHWSFSDPSSFSGTLDERLARTREVRDAIAQRVDAWAASLPPYRK